MTKYLTSINLSITSLGIAVLYYISNFFLIIPIASIQFVDDMLAIIESVIVIYALILAIKEKNKPAITLAVLLLIMFLKILI